MEQNDPNFEQYLSKIFEDESKLLKELERRPLPHETQKVNYNHAEAGKDDTHYNFTKIHAKQHKIPIADMESGRVAPEVLLDLLPSKKHKNIRII